MSELDEEGKLDRRRKGRDGRRERGGRKSGKATKLKSESAATPHTQKEAQTLPFSPFFSLALALFSRRNTTALTQSDATLVNAGLFLEFTESTIIWVYIKNGAVVSGLKVGVIIVYGILGGPRGMVWLQLQPFPPDTRLSNARRRNPLPPPESPPFHSPHPPP